jgi:hypothetical protein
MEVQGKHKHIVQCWVVLARFCPIIVQAKPLKTPFGLVTPFITIPITRSYNHTQLLLTLLRGYMVTILARLRLQSLIARLHRWLSGLCVDHRLLAVGLLTAVFAGWLTDSPAKLQTEELTDSVGVGIQPKVAFVEPSRSHPAQSFRNTLSRFGCWGNVCCVWDVGIRNVSGNRCIRNHGYLYPVEW